MHKQRIHIIREQYLMSRVALRTRWRAFERRSATPMSRSHQPTTLPLLPTQTGTRGGDADPQPIVRWTGGRSSALRPRGAGGWCLESARRMQLVLLPVTAPISSAPYRQPAPATRRRCPRDLMGLSLDLFLSAVPPRLVCPRAHNTRKIKQELKLKINRLQQGT